MTVESARYLYFFQIDIVELVCVKKYAMCSTLRARNSCWKVAVALTFEMGNTLAEIHLETFY
jgi:hypothetical protein